MNSSRTDYINIFLIILSCLIAFNLPFELFLFSYAVLGPLHYLSEIGWLHQRNYFMEGKRDYLFLVLCSFVLTLVFLWLRYPNFEAFSSFESNSTFQAIKKFTLSTSHIIVFLAFASAISFVVFKTNWKKYLFIGAALIASLFIKEVRTFHVIFAILVPTIIHVWLFTGLFMLSGARKSNAFSGYLTLVVFLLCSISFFLSTYKLQPYIVSEYIQSSFQLSGFSGVNAAINDFFFGIENNFHLNKGVGLKIQRFIAFAYTYHYLNWFSKTNVIKWHMVPKKYLISTIAIWIISVALYVFDYKTGTVALFSLSILHVFLEFPLNVKTFNIFESSKPEASQKVDSKVKNLKGGKSLKTLTNS